MANFQVRSTEQAGKIIDYLVTKRREEVGGVVTKGDIIEEAIQNFYKDLKFKDHEKINIEIKHKVYNMYFEIREKLNVTHTKLLDIMVKALYIQLTEIDEKSEEDSKIETVKIPLEIYNKLLADSEKLKAIQRILSEKD